MIYRKATIWDVKEITELWTEMLDEMKVPDRVADDIERERFFSKTISNMKNITHHIVIAEKNGIVGFIVAYLYYLDYGSSDLISYCDNLYVKPEYRNGEVANELIRLFVEWSEAVKAKEICFESIYDVGLIKVWQRRGYEPSRIVYNRRLS
jgi:GNAT superfamily N-acetyltransferase